MSDHLRTVAGVGAVTTWRATLLSVGFVVVAPTLLIGALSNRFGFGEPLFNVDLFAAYALMTVGGRLGRPGLVIASAMLVCFSTAMNILNGLGAIYLAEPTRISDYLTFARYWPWGPILFWTSLAMAVGAGFCAVARRVPFGKAKTWPVIAAALVVVVAHSAGATPQRANVFNKRLATSGFRTALQLSVIWRKRSQFQFEPTRAETMRSLVGGMPTAVRPDRILSIAVESWGLFNDGSIDAAMLVPFERAVEQGYEITIGQHHALKTTFSGELRELCGITAVGIPVAAAMARFDDRCLPKMLAAQGFATLGIHSNSGLFYDRALVYPGIGFGHTLFGSEWRDRHEPTIVCPRNVFRNVCDSSSLSAGLAFMGAHRRAFVHIMTLQTHFPLAESPLGTDRCDRFSRLSEPDLCLYANMMSNLLAQMGRQIAAAPSPPELVYIYGDHRPPFAIAAHRRQFRQEVPFIVLRRR